MCLVLISSLTSFLHDSLHISSIQPQWLLPFIEHSFYFPILRLLHWLIPQPETVFPRYLRLPGSFILLNSLIKHQVPNEASTMPFHPYLAS